MSKKTYYEKLKDPRWQKLRLEVMQYHDFLCEVCGDGESTLNVHHKEYFKNYEPWDYNVKQLTCLCENCHESTHDEIDLLKWVCSYASLDGPANRIELAYLIAGYMEIDYADILSISCHEDNRSIRNPYNAGVNALKESWAGIRADYLIEKE